MFQDEDSTKSRIPTFFRVQIIFMAILMLVYVGFILVQNKMFIRAQFLRVQGTPQPLDEHISLAAAELDKIVR